VVLQSATVDGSDELVVKKLKAAAVRPVALARALNVSPPSASLMLRQKRGIPKWHYDAIAALLGTSVPELFIDRDLIGHVPAVDSSLPHNPKGQESEDAFAVGASPRFVVPVAFVEQLGNIAATFKSIAARSTLFAAECNAQATAILDLAIEHGLGPYIRGQAATARPATARTTRRTRKTDRPDARKRKRAS
jgi:hypothetical protein